MFDCLVLQLKQACKSVGTCYRHVYTPKCLKPLDVLLMFFVASIESKQCQRLREASAHAI